MVYKGKTVKCDFLKIILFKMLLNLDMKTL